MSRALLDHVTASAIRKVPELKPGATVKVYQKIKEGGKERVQMFQGLIIRVNAGAGVDKTFTVRKVVEGVGVEKIFPVHTPTIEKIVIVKQGKVRRSKLYYMRDLQGKSTRLRETELAAAMGEMPEEKVEEPVVEEAPVEEAKVEETPAEEPAADAPAEDTPVEEAPAEEQK
jgi:large subunit ribosomal protein L19